MAISESTYYSFTKIRDVSPEAQDWATVDLNWEILSKVLKVLENHSHTGSSGITYPGYDSLDPPNPTFASLTEQTSGGILAPGSTVSVRLSYTDLNGLETNASPETVLDMSAASLRPLTLQVINSSTDIVPLASAIPGGTYIYVMTKGKGSGETLPSDILVITLSFDQTYSVELTFDAISSYTDGTDALHIYRSTGLDSAFQRITTITGTSTTTFTDTNSIDPANVNKQPPNVSTFDASKSVRIDWTALTHPANAAFLNVYVTREPRLWHTNHLLTQIDLTASPPDYVDYIGSETLASGWPRNTTEILNHPAKVNLSTDTTGGLNISSTSDFNGSIVNNLKLGDSPTVTKTDGMIWYDQAADTLQVRLNGSDKTIANSSLSLASTYTHPTESSGGHIAANIPFKASSGVSAKTIFDRIADTNGAQKQVQAVQRVVGVAEVTTPSTTPIFLTDMTIDVTPDFANQWVEIMFDAHMQGSAQFSSANIQLEIEGTAIEETIRGFTFPSADGSHSVHISWLTQLSSTSTAYTVNVNWWTSSGTIKAVGTRRVLAVRKVF